MNEVFLYNIAPEKAIKIKNLCRKLYLTPREIAPEEFGYKLAYLLGESDDNTVSAESAFSEEMLYFAGIGGMLSMFLAGLKRIKAPVALKAVRTDTNVQFTSYELYTELCAEREAIARGTAAHRTD